MYMFVLINLVVAIGVPNAINLIYMNEKHQNSFPWRLENGTTVCHFECKEHLQKYLDRYKLNARQYNISNKDGEPFESRKKYKKNVESSTGNSDNRGPSSSKRRTTRVDTPRNTSGVSKSKRKKK